VQIDNVRNKLPAHGNVPFQFAQVKGTGDSDHASWWTFDDEQELRDRWWKCGKGDLVLDIGAAFGSYALPALAQGARVVAFNPAPFDAELMDINLNLNPALRRRCLHVRDGLYSKDGWFNPDKCLFRDVNGQGDRFAEGQWLEVRALDSFLEERPGIGRVTWIKLDVEGAELDVLKGAEKCIRMYRPKILIENHEFQRIGIGQACIDFLKELRLGYVADGPHQHCAVSHTYLEAR
jgi:FkbM family methyltransferase